MILSDLFLAAVRAANGDPKQLIKASMDEAFRQPDGSISLDFDDQVNLAGQLGVLAGRYASAESFVEAVLRLFTEGTIDTLPTDLAPPEFLAADVAVLYDIGGFVYDIFLIRRGGETEHGKLAFAGGKKNNEDLGRILATAVREVLQEMGLAVDERDLKLITIFDGPGRDPRGDNRTSVLYAVEILPGQIEGLKAGDDAREIVRMRLADVPAEEMAFSHGAGIHALRKHYT